MNKKYKYGLSLANSLAEVRPITHDNELLELCALIIKERQTKIMRFGIKYSLNESMIAEIRELQNALAAVEMALDIESIP